MTYEVDFQFNLSVYNIIGLRSKLKTLPRDILVNTLFKEAVFFLTFCENVLWQKHNLIIRLIYGVIPTRLAKLTLSTFYIYYDALQYFIH